MDFDYFYNREALALNFLKVLEYSFDPYKEYIKNGYAYRKVYHERKDWKALSVQSIL